VQKFELTLSTILGKLEELALKESKYSSQREEFQQKMKNQNTLKKDAREPYKKHSPKELLNELNNCKNKLNS